MAVHSSKSRNNFSVMKWTNDGNRLSVHHLKHIVEPKKGYDMYNTGDIGLAVYPGYPGQWAFVILCVGGKRILFLDLCILTLLRSQMGKK